MSETGMETSSPGGGLYDEAGRPIQSGQSQETTVEAALTGSRDRAVEAMLLDPLAGRIDFDHVAEMTDEMLAATSRWLPQFA